MKYLCNDMHYLMGLCIADATQKHECVESLYYQARSNSRLLITAETVLHLRTLKLFDWDNFISIEEEDNDCYI